MCKPISSPKFAAFSFPLPDSSLGPGLPAVCRGDTQVVTASSPANTHTTRMPVFNKLNP